MLDWDIYMSNLLEQSTKAAIGHWAFEQRSHKCFRFNLW